MNNDTCYCSECGQIMEYFENGYYTDSLCDICRQKISEDIDKENML
jgi:hypothetical protein